jgi:RNA recognition motif-containing protein
MENTTKPEDTQEKPKDVEAKPKDADAKPESDKIKARAGRIIIRNIQFDVKEPHLVKEFAKYGPIVETNVPIKSDNNINRGFGFIEFDSKETAQKAIDAMNGNKWKGRTLALEFSVPKGSYESRIKGVVEHTNLDEKNALLPKVLRKEKEEAQAIKQKAEDEKKRYEEKNAAKIKKQEKKKAKKQADKKEEKEIVESATLFVRNIGFETNEKKFKIFMEKFGPVKYAVLCKTNGLKPEET